MSIEMIGDYKIEIVTQFLVNYVLLLYDGDFHNFLCQNCFMIVLIITFIDHLRQWH